VTEGGESELDAVGRILGAAVAGGVPGAVGGVPGLTVAVGRGPRTLTSWVLGQADTVTPRPVQPDTVFDLASLTKVVATTTVTLALAGQGVIGLDDRMVKHLPAATQLATAEVTVRQLLTHTSGLPDSVKFYEWCADRDRLLRALYATPLEAPPGTRVTYSDLGFMMLGEMAAAVTGEPLDALFRRLVSEPLGMADTGYLSDSLAGGPPAGGFAATELRADGTPWIGVVHDENARVMGGVAGHAGLFSTAADLAKFAAWWVGHDDAAGPVPAALRRDSERCQTPGLEGHRGLGWVRIGDRYDILGGAWPDSAVSHTGFTGTSLALDAPSGVWVVLLTNDVHYGRARGVIRPLREQVHAAVAAALLKPAATA